MLLVSSCANASPIQSNPGAVETFSNGITTNSLLVVCPSSDDSLDEVLAFCCADRESGKSTRMNRKNNELQVRIKVPKL